MVVDTTKNAEFISAEDMRKAKELYGFKKAQELKEQVMASDFYKEISERIKEAAAEGSSLIEVYSISKEEIAGYMDNHSLVPSERLRFTDKQNDVFLALRDFGKFHVGLSSLPFAYEDGTISEVAKCTIHW